MEGPPGWVSGGGLGLLRGRLLGRGVHLPNPGRPFIKMGGPYTGSLELRLEIMGTTLKPDKFRRRSKIGNRKDLALCLISFGVATINTVFFCTSGTGTCSSCTE